MTPERRKEFKSYAIIAVLLLAITGFRLGIHEMHQHAIDAGEAPPWAEGGEAEWRKSLEQDFQQRFPKGTELATLKMSMQQNGYIVPPQCNLKPDDQALRVACFQKQIYRRHQAGKAVGVSVVYDRDDKLVKMQFDYELTLDLGVESTSRNEHEGSAK